MKMKATIFAAWMIGGAAAITTQAATAVNYDTAWTFVYDGGKLLNDNPIPDKFFDVTVFPDGTSYCVGVTSDSSNWRWILLAKFNPIGEMLWKKRFIRSGSGHSIVVAKNGDFIIGGERGLAPLVVRLDTLGNIKWSTWYYDSVKNQNLLLQNVTINCLRETSRGTIVCAAGDEYPDNNGQPLNNYAAFLELDSAGVLKRYPREWNNVAGYPIAGFNIEETEGGKYLFSGNQSVFYLDSVGRPDWQTTYSYMLDGVGSEVANICRAKVLRGNNPMIAGQVYEGNCFITTPGGRQSHIAMGPT
jgi:hypothetical protein